MKNSLLNEQEMDDNARGVASKILCDLLNIGSTGTSEGTCTTDVNFYVKFYLTCM